MNPSTSPLPLASCDDAPAGSAVASRPTPLRDRFYRLSIWLRVSALVWIAIAIACTAIVLWAIHVQRETALKQAQDFAESVHQITIAGLTGMMITGTVNRSHVFLEQIERSRNVSRLRVIRGDLVIRQYGPPRTSALSVTDAEREVLQRGEPRYELKDDGGQKTLTALLPVVATRDYLGKNCIACHDVPEGSTVGAVSMELKLDDVYEAGRTFAYTVGAAAVAAGLLLLLPIYLLTTRFVSRPLAELTRGLQSIVRGTNLAAHRIAARGDDEIARATQAFNAVMDRARELLDAERVAASVFQHALEGIIITDSKGHIVKVNRAFTETTGYSAQEAIGRTPRILQSGMHDRAFYEALWRELVDKGMWRGDLWNRRKNGDIYVQSANITSVRDERGEVEHFIAVFSDVTEQRQKQAAIAHLAYHDALTGLPNRVVFEDRLRQAIVSSRRHGMRPLAVLFIDLDGFKQVNDTLGHETGDTLLREVARRLRTALREEDTVARLGGDEFTVLLPEVSDQSDASMVAERLLATLAPPCIAGSVAVPILASFGIGLFPTDGETPEALLLRADQAMYRMKRQRKVEQRQVGTG